MNKAYVACRVVIEKGRYGTVEAMMYKLDVFLANSRITEDEYEELVTLLNEKASEE